MAKVHENEFTLNMAGIKSFNFDLDDYMITDGQAWEGVTTEETSDSGIIIVTAGRKGSKETAEWFTNKAEQGTVIGCSSSSKYPKELNFAFMGTLSFTHENMNIKCKNVLIGQGHSTRNTWWLGGPNMTGMDTPFGGFVISSVEGALGKIAFASYIGQISSMEMGLLAL